MNHIDQVRYITQLEQQVKTLSEENLIINKKLQKTMDYIQNLYNNL